MRHTLARPLVRVLGSPYLLATLLLAATFLSHADTVVTVRIGVLAFRDLDQTALTWKPTADHLSAEIPGHRFEIVPLHNQDLERVVDQRGIDFILTQPEQYAQLRARYGLAALATLMPMVEGRPATQFGGVIFVRDDRKDIQSLSDIRGKRLSAVYENSFGAYRMQQWTLLKSGIRLPGDVQSLSFTGQPQDRVVAEVLAGRAEVGFVRTGVIESLQREGKLDSRLLRVINQQQGKDFPLRLSTDLYPEWPFAALNGVDKALVKAVTLSLLNITQDSQAARAGHYYGFSPPGDYAPVEAILLRLKANPGRLEQFDARDILEKYRTEILVLLFLLALLAVSVAMRLYRDNRRIRLAARERDLILASLGEGVCGIDPSGKCMFVNQAALDMLGCRQDDLQGQRRSIFDFIEMQELPGETASQLRSALEQGTRHGGEARLRGKDGQYLPVRYSITPMKDLHAVRGVVTTFQDITEQKRAEEHLRIAAVAFETQEGMIITDASSRILRVNQSFTRITGFAADEAIGHTPAMLKSGRHDPHFYEDMWRTLQDLGVWQGEVWNRRKNGEVYPEWLNISSVRGPGGETLYFVGTFLDISQHKQAEAQIEYMALYDPLTNLPNRRLLTERLERALVSRSRAGRFGALLFIDLDNFKSLNDTLGHDIGDQLLQKVAERLSGCMREGDTVARLGGDEFVVMLDDLGSNAEDAANTAELVGDKIVEQLGQPYHLGTVEHHGSASVGLTLFHDHDMGVDELLKRADLALYQAKAAGRNTLRFFDPAMQAAVEARVAMENDLRRGLKQGEFVLHYQPQVNAEGRVIGAEALARWQHPQSGLVAPGAFIPLAEATGLIQPLGQWVLEAACAQLAAWQAEPATASLTLSVNVSAHQFRQPDFVNHVAEVLHRHGVHPPRLKLELTESLMLEDMENVIGKMNTLKALGVQLALDDFGTGYSSLAYLKRLPLDQIKIDQSFVRDVISDSNDAIITRTVLALGETFGLEVIAEGVESASQFDFLTINGCQLYQGYLFGRPVPIEDFVLNPVPTAPAS
jgi:diguanylate cyclase (GGDEF)-like protein/PAS domain S-box-containing protein